MFILYTWTVVAMTVSSGSYTREYDWRHQGEFTSQAKCDEAARQLVIKRESYRCVPK